jgi:uncharacterized membrane protein
MKTSNRISAFIAYLLPVVGWLYVGIFRRKDNFARYHLRQAIALVLDLALVGAVWAVAAWVVAWIPYGFVFSMAMFALVIAAGMGLFVAWIIGMVNSLRGNQVPAPFAGGIARRLQGILP